MRFEQETEKKLRLKLSEDMKEARKMFEAEKRREVELRVGETRNEYEKQIQSLNENFQDKLKV